jgi:hypothetical protein
MNVTPLQIGNGLNARLFAGKRGERPIGLATNDKVPVLRTGRQEARAMKCRPLQRMDGSGGLAIGQPADTHSESAPPLTARNPSVRRMRAARFERTPAPQ